MNKQYYLAVSQINNLSAGQFSQQEIIKFGYPVVLEKCQYHRNANLICKLIPDNLSIQKKKKKICECCGRTIGQQPIKTLCVQNSVFAQYGPGIPLYFLFFKYIIYLVFASLLIFGIYALVSNFSGNDCAKQKHCWSNGFTMKISFLNSYEQEIVPLWQMVLVMLLIILQILTFLYIRAKLKKEKRLFDQALTSPSDFSLILRRLPEGTSKRDIFQMVEQSKKYLHEEQIVETNNLKVHTVIFSYDMREYLEVQQINLANFKKSCKDQTPFYKIPLPEISHKLSAAIVIFQKSASRHFFCGYNSIFEQIKRDFWLAYQPLSNEIKVKNEFVSVQRAPQPDDIIWENQGISITDLLVRRVSVLALSVTLLLVSAVIQYFIASIRLNYNLQDETKQKLFSLASASFVTFINFIIEMVLVISSQYEKPASHTLLKISLTFKIVLMQFINSGVISILISTIIFLPQFRFHKTLICNDMIYIMMMNVVVNNVFNFCWVYFEIPNLIARYKLKKGSQTYTQLQANKMFQANVVDIQYKYAYIFKTLWLTAFFMPTQPIVLFLAIIGLIINYWSEKYLFSSFYTIPQMFSGKISIAVLDLLNYTCLWLATGNFYIHYLRMPNQYKIGHLVCISLSIFVILVPLQSMSNKLFGKKTQRYNPHDSYETEQHNFQTKYENTNPAYKQKNFHQNHMDLKGQQIMYSLIKNPNSTYFDNTT